MTADTLSKATAALATLVPGAQVFSARGNLAGQALVGEAPLGFAATGAARETLGAAGWRRDSEWPDRWYLYLGGNK